MQGKREREREKSKGKSGQQNKEKRKSENNGFLVIILSEKATLESEAKG